MKINLINGYIIAAEIIYVSLMELEEQFAYQLEDKEYRQTLWKKYNIFLEELESFIEADIEQWIGGSYVTSKETPSDIDLVNWIPYSEKTNRRLGSDSDKTNYLFAMEPNPKSLCHEELQIDSYLEPVYPEHDPRYRVTFLQREKWKRKLTSIKNSFEKKGFVVIYLPYEAND